MLRRVLLGVCCVFIMGESSVSAADRFVSPNGKGVQDGQNEANAFSASAGGLQVCWDQLTPGSTCWVLPGRYVYPTGTPLRITIANDGEPGQPKRLMAWQGTRSVTFQGNRPVPYTPATKASGNIWIDVDAGASDLVIDGFEVERFQYGFYATDGGNSRLILRNLWFADTRTNVQIHGHPTATDDALRSHEILIENVHGVRHSKRHVRLDRQAHHVLVRHCAADSQFLDADWAVGFEVIAGHDIEFHDCTAQRCRYTSSKYWNGDGFAFETATANIRCVECRAFDNGDGGFDVKTPGAVLIRCLAERNKQNYRFWATTGMAWLIDSIARDAVIQGVGAQVGLWTKGVVRAQGCAFTNHFYGFLTDPGGNIQVIDSSVMTDTTTDTLRSGTVRFTNVSAFHPTSGWQVITDP